MEDGSFDLVLTDIHMPGMDGIEAAEAIRAIETSRPAAHAHRGADRRCAGNRTRACQEAGMDGFLTKPVEPSQLDEMFVILFPRSELPLSNAGRMTRRRSCA